MKRKPVSAKTLQMGMVYGGLITAMINPFVGAVAAGVLYKLYKNRKEIENAEREMKIVTERDHFKKRFYGRQHYTSYEAYLSSPRWRLKRALVIQRAKGICEKIDCTHALDEVHHNRYPRIWGNEPVDWLIGLCKAHHIEAHRITSENNHC